ncbi:MAG: ferredoxin [Mycobacteriales bacterium]
MHVHVNYEQCEANGLCMAAAPTVFELDDSDDLHVLQEDPGEELRPQVTAAVRACPKQAIQLT